MRPERFFTLNITCPDRPGIIAAVAGFLAGFGGSIAEANYHQADGIFFMRQEIDAASLPFDIDELRLRFAPIATEYKMHWGVTDSAVLKRVVVLVSKHDHCLNDLLYRWRARDLKADIPCVISNHPDLQDFVDWHGIPFHHVPMNAEDKAAGFREVRRLFESHRGDVMVLARYMQILPPDLCATYPGRIINIHHSFLPSFIGAKPYHQAYERGVKLIGATCHYVTGELDAGPIIEQDVVRIDHGDRVEDVVQYGKEVERSVLARGLRYHLEDRVLVHGNKTVVFK